MFIIVCLTETNLLSAFHPRTMADNAFLWAKARGLHRISEITGAEEADIPYDDSWVNSQTTGQRIEFENGAQVEVSCFLNP